MQLKKGDVAPNISLVDINNQKFELSNYRGKKVLLTFYRFASCPFCNLRIHNIVKNHDRYKEHFEIIAIFESDASTLQKQMKKYDSPFRIMSDRKRLYYDSYNIEKSFMGMLKGMIFRMPSLLKSMMMGNLPFKIDSSVLTMPADFVIDENGIIEIAYYAEDEGDHLDIDSLLKI